MERPAERRVSYESRPPWARDLNRAMDHGAPVYALAELLSPVTSRLMFPALDESEKLAKRHPIIGYATISLPLIADLALIGACAYFSNNNYAEFGELLIIRNAVTHVSLDIASVAGKGATRLLRHFRPPTTTLAL